MAMKKNISKALAMAVMMSVLAGGSAYAENSVVVSRPNASAFSQTEGEPKVSISKDTNVAGKSYIGSLSSDKLEFIDETQDNKAIAIYSSTAIELHDLYSGHEVSLSGKYGLDLNNLQIYNLADAIQDTNAVNKGQMDTALRGKADKATTLDGYGITNGATKTELADEAKAREDGDADTLKKANDYTDQEIAKISGGASTEALEKLDNKINQTNDRVDRVGATAAALAGIHYQPMAKGQSQVAVGMGGYKGKKATALGLAYQISDRVSGSVAGAANGSEHMFNVGFNYLFGQHSDKDIAQCAAVPGSVSLKEAELQSEVDSLKAHIAKQDAEMAELKAMVKALAAK